MGEANVEATGNPQSGPHASGSTRHQNCDVVMGASDDKV